MLVCYIFIRVCGIGLLYWLKIWLNMMMCLFWGRLLWLKLSSRLLLWWLSLRWEKFGLLVFESDCGMFISVWFGECGMEVL